MVEPVAVVQLSRRFTSANTLSRNAQKTARIAGTVIGLFATANFQPARALTSVSQNATLFVAPYGADSNPGTQGSPFLTVQHCAVTAPMGSTCMVRAGTYTETVTPNSGVTVTAFPGETVIFDGTAPITGWSRFSGSIYVASTILNSDDTNQIFVDQTMMTEARWPNGDDVFHPQWATAKAGTTSTQLVDSALPAGDWTGAHLLFWSGSDPWDPQTAVVTSSAAGSLTFTLDGASFQNFIVPQSGGYYYLFGSLTALDSPREWTYDATAHRLYFYAPGGVDPTTLNVRAKVRPYAFDLSGKSNVVINGVHLFASSINMDGSSSGNLIENITATYVSHFTTLPDFQWPSSYWYAHLWDSGIIVNGTNNSVINSSISYSAGNGITVLGSSHRIENNLIHHVDYIGNYSSGISVQGSGHTVQYNTIYATGRFAIFPNGINSGGFGPDNTDISYNDLSGSMMISRDGGAIYVSGAGGPPAVVGSSIHHNRIHDIQTIYPGPASNFALSGVYLDEDTSGWDVYQNVIWNAEYYNIFLHGSTAGVTYPNNNDVHNNSIPDAASTGHIWLQDVAVCGSTEVVHNVVLVPVVATNSNCLISDNGGSSPGATDMTSAVMVGCNLVGCVPSAPPTVVNGLVAPSIAYQPFDVAVPAGEPATIITIGNGSGPLAYQWQVSADGGNAWANLTDTGPYSGSTTATLAIASVIPSFTGLQYRCVVSNSVGSTTSLPAALTVTAPVATLFAIDRTSLNFGATVSAAGFGAMTAAQTVLMTQWGIPGSVAWSAASSVPWLTVSPASGVGSAGLTVAVRFDPSLPSPPATVSGTITIALNGAANTVGPVRVQLSLFPQASGAPFGSFDTPNNGVTGVAGSIPVTGWALDDIGVTRVTVCRDPVTGEGAPPTANCAGNAKVYIGDAVFVDGARPDVQGANPTLPLNSRGGWGYLMLTNFLPNLGNGTFNLEAYAFDADGHTTLLGTKTITCANASSAAPFGAIDTPGQGAVVSGSAFANFGWVLTQKPNFADPPDGGSVEVFVDGTAVGSPAGWTSRADLTSLFAPSVYAGVNSALAVFGLDTTTLSNGVHTIFWIVTGTGTSGTSGIGSRFFTVSNGSDVAGLSSSAGASSKTATVIAASKLEAPSTVTAESLDAEVAAAPHNLIPVEGRRGFDLDRGLQALTPSSGRVDVQAEELDRIELHLSGTSNHQYSGYLRTPSGLKPLPVGSTLNPSTGTFTWAPGVGFYGAYDLTFVQWSGGHAVSRQDVRITLNAKGSNRVGPQTIIDAPGDNAVVASSFYVGGWAADLDSSVDSGVSTVHVWAYPIDAKGNRLDPIFLGPAVYGGARPDVGAVYGDRFGNSGYGIIVNSLLPGTYDIAVFAYSTVVNSFTPAKVVRVTVR